MPFLQPKFHSIPMLLLAFASPIFQHAHGASPVVGILTQPRGVVKNGTDPHEFVIAASYVKWIESGGARCIPIPYDAPAPMIEDVFLQINGLLLPGGASEVPTSVHHLMTLALHASESKVPFPVWGTCLGFEYLVQVLSNSSTPVLMSGFEAENISLPLENVKQRQLYSHSRIYDIVVHSNVTMNNHYQGVEPEQFRNNANLNGIFEITSTNHDQNGRPFVSTIEPRNPKSFPFYGVQYHPEKNAFEYGSYPGTNIPYEAINHSDAAVEFSNYLARFFGTLTRAQQQKQQPGYHPQHEYTKPTLYPLVNTYPIKRSLGFEEYYVIPSATSWSTEVYN